MDIELQALCEAALRCNAWAREFVKSYSRCNDAPRETEGFLPDYWTCGNRSRTRLRNAQRLLEKLECVVREFTDPEYDDAWSCIEQAVNNDQPQRYTVGTSTHIVAHEAAFAQAEYVLLSASELGMTAIVDELGLKDGFKTIRTAAEQFRTIKFDDLRALIRRESGIAIRTVTSNQSSDGAASPNGESNLCVKNEPAKAKGLRREGETVNQAMMRISNQKKSACIPWTLKEWAEKLHCSRGAIGKSPIWKAICKERESSRQNRRAKE